MFTENLHCNKNKKWRSQLTNKLSEILPQEEKHQNYFFTSALLMQLKPYLGTKICLNEIMNSQEQTNIEDIQIIPFSTYHIVMNPIVISRG